MLSPYVEQGQGGQALQIFCQMQETGTVPNHLTTVFALHPRKRRSCFCEGTTKKDSCFGDGGALHEDAIAKGFTSDAFFGNTLLSMYGKYGYVLERDNVFMTLHKHDIISWNAMLCVSIMEGEAMQALRLYKQLQDQNMIVDDATLICQNMIVDDATLICTLQAYSMTGSLEPYAYWVACMPMPC